MPWCMNQQYVVETLVGTVETLVETLVEALVNIVETANCVFGNL